MRIGVFGHYGNQNLGDEAITTATIQHIKQHIPNADIVGFSVKPDDTSKRHNIVSYPIRYIKPSSASLGQNDSKPLAAKEVEGDINGVSENPGLKDQLKKFLFWEVC